MTQYVPMAPNITVYGQTTSVFIDVLKQFSVLQKAMLDALGVEQFDPHSWYPQELILRAYQKVDLVLGGRGLERFGRQIPPLVAFPPGIDDAHTVLSMLDATYHLNHSRDGVPMLDLATGEMTEGIGHYAYERVGEREVLMRCDNPYPCRFDMGLIAGFAERFAAGVEMSHEPGGCRAKGGEKCVYRVRW
ncbi:hypothetical protein SAMN02745121_01191 [Nannocystis exedens]|uniref:4-vinyl reductase 4VR domain-containing protein n=1 Tax=Nannocystis exedens TaxID=54 RepID=A0A1I1UEE4_9BACT|nr:hypothetical protein [Nannocystis exedens]PCC71648.1 hypothetical protein NAEX_04725 [Nannocystis exedens]SFD69216.1 hypothetical protein SAMN02745121_01191 [Nannocystis exedens]